MNIKKWIRPSFNTPPQSWHWCCLFKDWMSTYGMLVPIIPWYIYQQLGLSNAHIKDQWCLQQFFLRKCQSILICFVLSWWTRFFKIAMVDLLLQWTWIALWGIKLSPFRIILTHNLSQIPWARDLSSASVLDLATTFCFLLLHSIWFPPISTQ